MNKNKFDLLERVLPDIRELKQQLISSDVGVLTEIKIQFLGDEEPTKIIISQEKSK